MHDQLTIDHGYCKCGCGARTNLASVTDPKRGYVKGEPYPFLLNHDKRIAVRYIEEDRGYETSCWVWQGSTSAGYGRIKRDGRGQQAHRWYYEQHVGPIPEGLDLDHLCRVTLCVNPEHMEPVTHAENVRRGNSPAQIAHRTGLCKRGHALSGANVRIRKDGHRTCRACRAVRER